MQELLFQLQRSGKTSLQCQIRELLVSGILGGQIPPAKRLPSSRDMARALRVSRNTVMLAYQGLIDDGYLIARERSGYYVNGNILSGRVDAPKSLNGGTSAAPDWRDLLQVRPARQKNINKPAGWHDYPYPFIYGQIDHKLFPIAEWRECCRQVMGKKWLDAWTEDVRDRDDRQLVEQIRTRLLPRRGIMADEDEILVTLGAQNALYILASLLISTDTAVGIEDPGYPDARNIFSLKTPNLIALPVDENGLTIDQQVADCDIVFVTPSHQYPTTVTMPMERREKLLRLARDHELIVIEDDYEFETNYLTVPTPALKSLDKSGRVIYVGSLSKTLFPGLRLGYMVGPKALVAEARALRRLMVRHPPSNNQRIAALFLSLGYHDALIHRLHRTYRARWQEMGMALERHLPGLSRAPGFGGTSFWVRGPDGLNADMLAEDALEEGVVIEPGRIFFHAPPRPEKFFRLGFSSIAHDRIETGIKSLARLIERQLEEYV